MVPLETEILMCWGRALDWEDTEKGVGDEFGSLTFNFTVPLRSGNRCTGACSQILRQSTLTSATCARIYM